MKVVERDEKTIVLEPESVAELTWLRLFNGATAEIEKPEPFAPNVEVLKLTKKGESA